MILEQNGRIIDDAIIVGEVEIAAELRHREAGGEEEGAGVRGVADLLSALSKQLPSCENRVELGKVKKEDGVVGGVHAAHCATDEALDVETDQQLKHLMEVGKLFGGVGENVAVDDITAWETSVHVLPLQTPTTSRWRNLVLAYSYRTGDDAIVHRPCRVTKAVGVVPDGSCVRCHGEWSPVVERNRDTTFEIFEEVLVLQEEVPIKDKVLALGGHTGLCDVV